MDNFNVKISYNEFHISRSVRDACGFDERLYASTGNVIIADIKAVRVFTEKLNALFDARGLSEKRVSAGSVNAMGLIDEIFHYVAMLYRRDKVSDAFVDALANLEEKFGKEKIDMMLHVFCEKFPPVEVYQGKISIDEYLAREALDTGTNKIRSNREQTLEEIMLLRLANENPAFKPFGIMFDDAELAGAVGLATGEIGFYDEAWASLQKYFSTLPGFGPYGNTLVSLLREPVAFSPNSLRGQLEYIMKHWKVMLGEWIEKRLLGAMDTISEEEKAAWVHVDGGSAEMQPYSYENLMREYERFSADSGWMPNVVLLAKTVLVWLDQLTKKYGRPITRLDQIPDEELDVIAAQGFTGLWLIGLWERSNASRRIKQICGNPEAAASAYSLLNYEIASNIGGWDALANLRQRLWQRGVRLASDMVPNHTGMDSNWVTEKPDVFVQRRDNPYPQYTFNGENLSHDSRVGIYLEDHYYSKNDCAVVFKRVDNQTGDVRYIYHGNDGTGMPWNDTAQIDFLNPAAREAVMQEIIHVAQNFPIIRFDAAMVLAKKSIRRLWYPEPGHGGDIATRSESAISLDDFEKAIPNEFWREVVDRIAQEVPDTLLLAEAFWMMEGYFVRTLGMHRVYNSAFMNMLKKEENQKYRIAVKNTLEFDPQVLKRYVNFMNNPDEETAVVQFGRGDKYFGVCTLMITMPGLPMFGHGQIEGFEEKYGMEYTKAYKDEKPDEGLIARHWHDIFPLMKKRYLFSEMEHFLFYDLRNENGVNENVFAYSNGSGHERTLVFYNNKYESASGWIKDSLPYAVKTGNGDEKKLITRSLAEGLGLTSEDDKYLIFQEHHSKLWYVRKSATICEQGMFVMLNGFESQVLMDIHQVADMPDGRYRILCESLAGRGCLDLNDAWDEIRYKDLYAAFAKYVDAALVTLKPVISPVHAEEIDLSAEHVSASTDETEAVAKKLAEKSASAKVSASKKTSASVTKKIDEMLKAVKQDAISLYEEANKIVEKENAALGVKAKKLPTATSQFTQSSKAVKEVCAKYLSDTKNKFAANIYAYDKTLSAQLLSYALVAPLANSGKAKAYGLARKFTEHLGRANIAQGDVRVKLERMFVLSTVASADVKKKDVTLKIARLFMDSDYAGLLCGANYFGGIKWFNKELTDGSVDLLFTLLSIKAGTGDDKALAKLYSTITSAKNNAEYKCAEFLKPFMPKKKATATAKKATASKTTATAKKATAGKATATAKKATASKVTATAKKTTASKVTATAKKTAASKATATAKKATAGKATAAAKKTTAGKATATAKKSTADKATTAAKKTTASKATATAKKTTASKETATAKKTTASKATATAKKTTAGKVTAAAKKSTAGKVAATAKKTTASKATATAKKTAASKATATAKKTTASKATAVAKKSTAGKATATAKKTTASKSTATAKKTTASKAATAAKKTTTSKATATAKKTTASKATATAKKTAASKVTATAKKATASKAATAAKKTAASKAATSAKKTTASKATTAAKKSTADKATTAAKKTTASKATAAAKKITASKATATAKTTTASKATAIAKKTTTGKVAATAKKTTSSKETATAKKTTASKTTTSAKKITASKATATAKKTTASKATIAAKKSTASKATATAKKTTASKVTATAKKTAASKEKKQKPAKATATKKTKTKK